MSGFQTGSGREGVALQRAIAQAGHGAAARAVHLDREQVIAAHAHAPGGVEVADDAVFQLEHGVGAVIGVGVVGRALLVDAFRHVVGGDAGEPLDRAEKVVDHVAPVGEHIENDAAALGLLVVPGGALGRLVLAIEDPVAELAAHGQNAAKETGVDQILELQKTGQKQLILDNAIADPGVDRRARQLQRILGIACGRLFAVDRLARLDRLQCIRHPQVGGQRIEIDAVVVVGERLVQVGCPLAYIVGSGEMPQLVRIAADQHRLRHDAVAVGGGHAALFPDRQNRTDQMLIRAHAPGDAIQDYAKRNFSHR